MKSDRSKLFKSGLSREEQIEQRIQRNLSLRKKRIDEYINFKRFSKFF